MKVFLILIIMISIVQTIILEKIENKVQNVYVRLVLNDKCVEQARNNKPILVS
jgi:hypothetical protein